MGDPLVFAALAVATGVLRLLPIRLADQRLPISLLRLALIASWLLSGLWLTTGLALGSIVLGRLARAPARLGGAWQVAAGLAGVGTGAAVGSLAASVLSDSSFAEPASASGFALGHWLGQTLCEWCSPARALARQSWLLTLLTAVVLVPAGLLLGQIGAIAAPAVFGAALGLVVGLVALIRALIERELRGREEAELTARLSHELRGPLTTILGYAQLIARQTSRNPRASPQAEYVERISESGDYMLRLINNLLDLERLGHLSEALPREPVDVAEVTRAVVEAHRPQATTRSQQLSAELPSAPLVLPTNELALRQILTNLVANAVKYTPLEGKVCVTLTADESWVVWRVADTGIGISPEEQRKLFTPFFRGERPEARETRGTGLGLALTHELVERLGGSISVESALNQGATFTVRLPRAAEPSSQANGRGGSLAA